MFIIIAVLLASVSTLYVAWPLFRQQSESGRLGQNYDQLHELDYQKELANDTIQDLNFDLQTGKLSSADHAALVASQQALIKNLESRIADKNVKKNGSAAQSTKVNAKVCPACGYRSPADARFCSQCGATLK